MIYKIDKNGRALVNPELKKLSKKLIKLDTDRLLFLIFAYDYGSPFHRFPEDERVRKAKLYVFGKSDAEFVQDKFFEECKEEYISFQYDIRYETIRAYEKKIIDLTIQLSTETMARKIGEIDEAIDRLSRRIVTLQQEIDVDEETQRIIKGGGELSEIEKWQQNQKKAMEDKRRREAATGVENI